MKVLVLLSLGILPLILLVGCAGEQPRPGREELVASDDVPEAVAGKARRLAEEQPALRAAMQETRVVYVGTELTRLKTEDGGDPQGKHYVVIHYRYDNDAAIHSLVSVDDGTVLDQQEAPHLPTSLAQEELDRASTLALGDGRVREALGSDVERVEIEPLVIRPASKEDPWFGRRVVQLLFRVGRDYRHSPRTVVDLTNDAVLVEANGELK